MWHACNLTVQHERFHALVQFIYISPEEMVAVASFIKQHGRVAIAELVRVLTIEIPEMHSSCPVPQRAGV